METSKLQFNIIYTPGTVRYLTPFVTTLLKWSDCRYRLVANGCDTDEIELLNNVVALDQRLELLVMPEQRMVPHGETLNFLHARTDSEYFCFMDSDIVATGPFLDDFLPKLATADCFSSCLPLWHDADDIVIRPALRHMHGIHAYTETGATIACDYFVVYRNSKLSKMMLESDVTLKVVSWQELPVAVQQKLQQMGQQKADYDTGKVLTMLMQDQGDQIDYLETDKLKHIGGFTEVGARKGALLFSRGTFDNIAARGTGALGRYLIRCADIWYAWRAGNPDNSWLENRLLASRVRRRTATARYFYLLIVGLLDDQPLPDVPLLGDVEAEQRIRAVSEEIRALAGELRNQPGPWKDIGN